MNRRNLLVRLMLIVFALTLLAGAGYTQCTPHGTKGAAVAATVDINSASKEELAALPGMDASSAQKIIENRPYESPGELVSRDVLTQAQYDKIKSRITANKK